MRYDEFIGKVQEYAGIKDREEAEKATAVVLETLGERLSREEREHVAAQLPLELKDHFFRWTETKRFDRDAFYNRVFARMNTGFNEAESRAKSVLRVLQEAIAPGEMAHVRRDFYEGWGDLL